MSGLRRVLVLGPIPAFGWLLDRLRGFGRGGNSSPVPDAALTPDPVAAPDAAVPRGADVPLPHDVAIERARPLARVRHQVTDLMTRAGNPDVTNGVQILAGSGAGRIAALGAIAGLCLSGLGAGTVCVVRGITPLDWLHPDRKPAVVHRTATVKPAPTPTPHPKPTSVPTPAATPRARIVRHVQVRHSVPPKRQIPRGQPADAATPDPAAQEFGFEPTAQPNATSTSIRSQGSRPSAASSSAPDPATEEFGP